jgi:ABC-type uncharacterized transport system fused permease/ATPase subunit
MKRESIQAWLIIGLVVIIILLVFMYFNLSVSEKYETQLEGINATKEELKNAIDLKNKIDFQKKLTLFMIIICFFLFYPIAFLKKKF